MAADVVCSFTCKKNINAKNANAQSASARANVRAHTPTMSDDDIFELMDMVETGGG